MVVPYGEGGKGHEGCDMGLIGLSGKEQSALGQRSSKEGKSTGRNPERADFLRRPLG